MEIKEIEDLVIRTLNELINVLDVKNNGLIEPNTRLFGTGGVLDSMGLVSFITDLEERMEIDYNISIILADEKAMSQERSPFRTVSSLSRYIYNLVDKNINLQSYGTE